MEKRRTPRYCLSHPKAKSRRYHRQGSWILLAEAVREEMERLQARRLLQLALAEQKIEETDGGFTGPVTDGQAKASREIDVAVAALDDALQG